MGDDLLASALGAAAAIAAKKKPSKAVLGN